MFQTHFFDRWAAAAFTRLSAGAPAHHDCIVLLHLPPDAPVPERVRGLRHHIVRTPELRALPYPAKVGGGAAWNLWSGGHTDLITLRFCLAHPEYERTWTVEYDVAFSGPWGRFFEAFEEDDSDLLAPVVLRRRDFPDRFIDCFIWSTFVTPSASPADTQALRSFMPIFRMSRRLVEAVDAAYRAGWGGHVECSLATIAAMRGLTVGDIGGDGEFTAPRNRGRFYSSNRRHRSLSPGTLVFRPVRHRAGTRPDMLWHPVKPFSLKSKLRNALLTWRSATATLIRTKAPWLLPARWRELGSFSGPRRRGAPPAAPRAARRARGWCRSTADR